jgi:hypothetical protein
MPNIGHPYDPRHCRVGRFWTDLERPLVRIAAIPPNGTAVIDPVIGANVVIKIFRPVQRAPAPESAPSSRPEISFRGCPCPGCGLVLAGRLDDDGATLSPDHCDYFDDAPVATSLSDVIRLAPSHARRRLEARSHRAAPGGAHA